MYNLKKPNAVKGPKVKKLMGRRKLLKQERKY